MLCTGCGICPNRCPFGAIEIINLPTALNKPPIHRYGENLFELYSLPAPLFGKVTGILEPERDRKINSDENNGGNDKTKSGELAKSAGFQGSDSLFQRDGNAEIFGKAGEKEISLSYKPQQIDSIPSQFSGKVKSLLSKIDQSNKLIEVVDKLVLIKILDNDISTVSGGELQRIAIAASSAEKANLYLFDEPASFFGYQAADPCF